MKPYRYILLFAVVSLTVFLSACTFSLNSKHTSNSNSPGVTAFYTSVPSGSPEQDYIPTQASLDEALGLLETTISAMSTATSYHYKILNPARLHGLELVPEMLEKSANDPDFEGDVVPPMARFSTGTETILVGKDEYTRQPFFDKYTLDSRGWDMYWYIGAINEPVRFLSYARHAECGGIMGDEIINGINTTHMRFAVIGPDGRAPGGADEGSPEYYPGPSAALDLWVAKDTHYIKQQQILNMYEGVRVLCKSGIYQTSSEFYSEGLIILSNFNVPIEPPIIKPDPSNVSLSR